jgi:organic hydroperoxide reductase OsmC/OhrA
MIITTESVDLSDLCMMAGAGKVNLQFSEDARWAFSRTAEEAARSKVDWNVCFSPEQCDQYGNTPTTVPEDLLAKAQVR